MAFPFSEARLPGCFLQNDRTVEDAELDVGLGAQPKSFANFLWNCDLSAFPNFHTFKYEYIFITASSLTKKMAAA